MIYVTGDMHGDKTRFSQVQKSGIRKDDTLIVCGDFGFLWNGGKEEMKTLKWIGKRRYHVLFVDGCNENHELLWNSYPETDFMGGKARQISGNLYLLSRGEVYIIENQKVFAFGGGSPSDPYAAGQGDAYLLPTPGELENARRNLARFENRVDLIVTHDAPEKLRQFINLDSREELTHLNTFLEEIAEKITFREWFFGKYHINRFIPPRYHMLFTAVEKVSK